MTPLNQIELAIYTLQNYSQISDKEHNQILNALRAARGVIENLENENEKQHWWESIDADEQYQQEN